jgi:hypothetical protein
MFFCTDVNLSSGPTSVTFDEYLALFDAGAGKLCGEGSVWYLYSQVAALHIRRFNPHAKIIIMLRNPVDCMYSMHTFSVYQGNQDLLDFEEALAAIPDRMQGRRLPKGRKWPEGRIRRSLLYTEIVKFTAQIERYLQEFRREQVLILLFDDLIQDTARVYRQTLEFLGVEPTFQPDFLIHNKTRQVRSPLIQLLLWKHIPPSVLTFARTHVPKNVRSGAFQALNRMNTTAQVDALDMTVRTRLQTEFAPEIDHLSTLIGRDLSHWYAPAQTRRASGLRE